MGYHSSSQLNMRSQSVTENFWIIQIRIFALTVIFIRLHYRQRSLINVWYNVILQNIKEIVNKSWTLKCYSGYLNAKCYIAIHVVVYHQTPNPKTEMFLVSFCNYLCPIHWNQVLSRKWRCSWRSADRRCSNYIWVLNNNISFSLDISHPDFSNRISTTYLLPRTISRIWEVIKILIYQFIYYINLVTNLSWCCYYMHNHSIRVTICDPDIYIVQIHEHHHHRICDGLRNNLPVHISGW